MRRTVQISNGRKQIKGHFSPKTYDLQCHVSGSLLKMLQRHSGFTRHSKKKKEISDLSFTINTIQAV